MNYEEMNNNRAMLTGKVTEEAKFSHEVFGEGFYEIKLEVPRLSAQTDVLPVTISERLLACHDASVGSTLSVIGQFRSYNKLEEERSRLTFWTRTRNPIPTLLNWKAISASRLFIAPRRSRGRSATFFLLLIALTTNPIIFLASPGDETPVTSTDFRWVTASPCREGYKAGNIKKPRRAESRSSKPLTKFPSVA